MMSSNKKMEKRFRKKQAVINKLEKEQADTNKLKNNKLTPTSSKTTSGHQQVQKKTS